jgi:hypothetical protein
MRAAAIGLYYVIMQAAPSDRPRAAGATTDASAAALDAWVREVVDWHFNPSTGSPFWLEFAN